MSPFLFNKHQRRPIVSRIICKILLKTLEPCISWIFLTFPVFSTFYWSQNTPSSTCLLAVPWVFQFTPVFYLHTFHSLSFMPQNSFSHLLHLFASIPSLHSQLMILLWKKSILPPLMLILSQWNYFQFILYLICLYIVICMLSAFFRLWALWVQELSLSPFFVFHVLSSMCGTL